jgi:hypothetical protein
MNVLRPSVAGAALHAPSALPAALLRIDMLVWTPANRVACSNESAACQLVVGDCVTTISEARFRD